MHDDEIAHVHLGEIAFQRNDKRSAIVSYDRARARVAQNPEWAVHYAACLIDDRQTAKAVEVLKQLSDVEGKTAFEAGVLLGRAGAHADAARFFGAARKTIATLYAAGFNQILMLIETADYDDAIQVAGSQTPWHSPQFRRSCITWQRARTLKSGTHQRSCTMRCVRRRVSNPSLRTTTSISQRLSNIRTTISASRSSTSAFDTAPPLSILHLPARSRARDARPVDLGRAGVRGGAEACTRPTGSACRPGDDLDADRSDRHRG